jgi:hypothetical protein
MEKEMVIAGRLPVKAGGKESFNARGRRFGLS